MVGPIQQRDVDARVRCPNSPADDRYFFQKRPRQIPRREKAAETEQIHDKLRLEAKNAIDDSLLLRPWVIHPGLPHHRDPCQANSTP